MLLKGKAAVISGAASPRGIGRSTATLMAEQGARIAILDLDEDKPVTQPRRLGPSTLVSPAMSPISMPARRLLRK